MKPLNFGTRTTINIPEGFQSDKEFREGKTTRSVSVNALNRAGGEANYWRKIYSDRLRKQYKAGKYTADEYSTIKDNIKSNLAKSAEVYDNGVFRGFSTGSKAGGFVTSKTAMQDIEELKRKYRFHATQQGYAGAERYAHLMDEAKRLGIDVWDYAESVVEDRYYEALRHNAVEIQKKKDELQAEYEDLRRQYAGTTGLRRAELEVAMDEKRREIEIVQEISEEYGTGQPRDLRKRAGYSALTDLFD